jgi:hypothetical protein
MDGDKSAATHQCQGFIEDSEWFQPCHVLHSLKHKHLRFPCFLSLTILHSSADAEVLHSTAREEQSKGAFFHLLH